jgi:ubiquinone/menaquinone biosynthesis C-methylase UbiE
MNRRFWKLASGLIRRTSAPKHCDQTNQYLTDQRAFWNADGAERTLMFGRVDIESRDAAEYKAMAAKHFSYIFAGSNIGPESTILDIGCGIGRLLRLVCERLPAKQVLGVDISDQMIAYARQALSGFPQAVLAVNSGSSLAMIGDESVDFAYSNDVFIHIHDISVAESYLAEIRRVLKPEGYFKFNVRLMDPASAFANTPGGLVAKATYWLGLNALDRSAPAIPGFDGLEYTRKELQRIVSATGLKAESIRRDNGRLRLWCSCRPRK